MTGWAWLIVALAIVGCAELARRITVCNNREAMHDDPDDPEGSVL